MLKITNMTRDCKEYKKTFEVYDATKANKIVIDGSEQTFKVQPAN